MSLCSSFGRLWAAEKINDIFGYIQMKMKVLNMTNLCWRRMFIHIFWLCVYVFDHLFISIQKLDANDVYNTNRLLIIPRVVITVTDLVCVPIDCCFESLSALGSKKNNFKMFRLPEWNLQYSHFLQFSTM